MRLQKLKIAAVVLAVLAPAAVLSAPSLVQGFANFISQTPVPGRLTGDEIVGAVQNGATTRLTLSNLAAYIAGQLGSQLPTDVSLSGVAPIPLGNHQVNAVAGATLTLPANAAVGTTDYVSDYQGNASASTPITVAPSSDALITGYSGSYTLTLPYQATGFRRTATAWQLY